MSIEDAVLLRNAKRTKLAAKRKALALSFWREIGSASHSAMRGQVKSLRKPKVECLGDSVTATWGVGSCYVSITSMRGDVFVTLERESTVVLQEDFRLPSLINILNAALSFQKVDRSS
jgi:hypothetical protein